MRRQFLARRGAAAATRCVPKITTLYVGPGPNPEMVKLGLASKGVDVKSITRRFKLAADGTPENRLREFTKLNPAATTPFVELEDGTILAESVAIARYADALYPDAPALLGGPDAKRAAEVEMWLMRIMLQIVMPWQRSFQAGEAAPYFASSKLHPWTEAAGAAVPSLRMMVAANLEWLEGLMADSRGADEFIAGGTRFTLPDLQLYTTAKFMAKVNTAKRTPPFDGREAYGPWLKAWEARMDDVVAGLK